jgi:hypothetical protein
MHRIDGSPLSGLAAWTVRAVPVLTIALLIIGLQVMSGAYGAELSTPDESVHFVTGLMIRDYVAHSLPASPMHFAIDYYVHYPKIAFGAWPPLFHFVEAFWLLVWPPSRSSGMVLLATITFLVALTLYRTARRFWGRGKALGIAVLLVALPETQFLTNRLLADSLIGLFDLWATLWWARYLDGARLRDALAFGLLAGMSMLTKQNGVALLLIPILTVPLTGQWTLLRRGSFWCALTLAGIIGIPFALYSWRIFVGTDPGGTTRAHVIAYLGLIASGLGPALWPLALFGTTLVVAQRFKASANAVWSALVALPVAILIVHPFTPNLPSSRYLWPAFPSFLLLAGYATEWLATRISAGRAKRRQWCEGSLAAVIVIVFCGTTFAISRKPHFGFDQVAEAVAGLADCHGCVVLASSRMEREGMLIAEIAMRDRRPEHFILRADKMLSQSDWIGANYTLLYSDPEEVQQWLIGVPVKLVVIDDAGDQKLPHHELLLAALRSHREWIPVETPPAALPPGVVIYRNAAAANQPGESIKIDMSRSLGRTIVTTIK